MKSGDFTHQIAFQSSSRNVAGVLVRIWVSGIVCCKRMERWREQQPRITTSDYVAGGQIHNLIEEPVATDWNLADPATRDETVTSIVSAVELVALPYFSKFDDVDALVELLVKQDIPSMTIDSVIEFLICFAGLETARTAAVNFLERRPDLVRSYSRDYGRYAERGLDWSHPSGYAKQLAFASHLFGFGNLTQRGA